MMKKLVASIILSLCVCVTYAQTARSLFWCSDSLQVEEIVSEAADLHESVGHCGPAVENSHMALRIYFDDSGCVDVYSKSGRGMELLEYNGILHQDRGIRLRQAAVSIVLQAL